MESTGARICGLELGRDSILGCIRTLGTTAEVRRNFGVANGELSALRDWLVEQEVAYVALSSTGGFWKPILRFLEDHVHVVLVDSGSPDPSSAESGEARIARLLEEGLLRGEPALPAAIRDLEHLKL